MRDEFVNRLAMFQTCLGTLNSAEHKPVWFQQPPLIFSTKVEQAAQAVADLEAFARQQEADTTGTTQDKQREEAELEEAAHLFGSTLAIWFGDQDDQANAAQVDLPPSGWGALRDQQLLEKARLARDLGQSVVDGAQAEEAAAYGISAEEVARLSKEIDDYAAAITAPQQSIAQRRAITAQLRDRFNAVARQFDALDKLILHFGRTAGGRALIATYQASRIIHDRGRGSSSQPDETSAPSDTESS